MTAYSFLLWAPLASALVWFAAGAYLVAQQRYRTWTEIFFLAMCASVGGYCLSDAVFFGLPRGEVGIAASASLTCVTLMGLFLFLYGTTLYDRFRRVQLVALVPVVFFLVTIPGNMFADFVSIGGDGAPYVPVYNELWFVPWVLILAGLGTMGVVGVLRTYLEVRRQNPRLARRIGSIFAALVFVLAVGASTNVIVGLLRFTIPPLFSSTLFLPGVAIFFEVTPASFHHLNVALLHHKASQYDVKAVFLTYYDGTLIGSKTVPEEQMIDADSFSATLDVIQNFMRTSFPTLRGKWLQSIRHGDYTLVMERGRYAYVTVVLGGQENDQLRRQIIQQLQGFEEKNLDALEHWRGMAKDASGVDELLSALLIVP
jgi:hypothetical protein